MYTTENTWVRMIRNEPMSPWGIGGLIGLAMLVIACVYHFIKPELPPPAPESATYWLGGGRPKAQKEPAPVPDCDPPAMAGEKGCPGVHRDLRPKVTIRTQDTHVTVEGYNPEVTLCIFALVEMSGGLRITKDHQARVELCLDIMEAAYAQNISPTLLVSIAYEETRLQPKSKKSPRGAAGPLQVMPHHHCPGRTLKGCDLKEAGVIALRKYVHLYACGEDFHKRAKSVRNEGWGALQDYASHEPLCQHPNWKEALCHYNSGEDCYKSSRKYAAKVLKRKERLDTMKAFLHEQMVRDAQLP